MRQLYAYVANKSTQNILPMTSCAHGKRIQEMISWRTENVKDYKLAKGMLPKM